MNDNAKLVTSRDISRPALVTSAAKFSVLVHTIAFVLGGLTLLGINFLLSLFLDGRWLVTVPMTWWGAALLLHAGSVWLASWVSHLRTPRASATASAHG